LKELGAKGNNKFLQWGMMKSAVEKVDVGRDCYAWQPHFLVRKRISFQPLSSLRRVIYERDWNDLTSISLTVIAKLFCVRCFSVANKEETRNIWKISFEIALNGRLGFYYFVFLDNFHYVL